MAIVRLKNTQPSTLAEQAYYFYDGRTLVHFGIIEVPSDQKSWLQRVFMDGYRVDPESGEWLDLQGVMALAESAESAGEDIEGTDLGGQPAGQDGLRSSELPRDAGVPASRVGSSRSPRTAKRTARN